MSKNSKSSDNMSKNPVKVEMELGKMEGDQPFYKDYNYTSKEWSVYLESNRLCNKMWVESGYVMDLEEK